MWFPMQELWTQFSEGEAAPAITHLESTPDRSKEKAKVDKKTDKGGKLWIGTMVVKQQVLKLNIQVGNSGLKEANFIFILLL